MFSWYGDLEGSQTVQVTPPALDAVDTLQGIGAIDTANRKATVLYGGGSKDVRVDLSGIDPTVFGAAVDVEVREARLTGAEGVADAPRVVQAAQDVAVVDGSLDLTVPTYDRYAGYQIVITPAQDRDVQVTPVFETSVEAEDTALTSATVYTQDPQSGGGWKFLASHGKDVGSFNRVTSKADWTVEVPRDGTYRFQVVGAAPGVPGRHALFVDDALATTVQYRADLALNGTSKWQYRGSAEVEVALTAGTHVLSLRASADGSTLLPNADITLDTFTLTDVTDGEPTTYPASTLRLVDGAALSWAEGTRGWADLPTGGRIDAYVHAWETGYHDLAVTWASAAAGDVALTVNGEQVATLTSPGAGTWASTVRVHLAQGIDEVELRSTTGATVRDLTVTATDDPGASVTVEAEDATLRGTARVVTHAASTGSNASGSRSVGNVGQGRQNAVVLARQEGFDQPGTYLVTVHYANAEVSGTHDYNPQVVDRRLDVWEQGVEASAGHAYLRYTYAWTSFLERTFVVHLTTADAALEIGRADGWAPDLDSITIAPLTASAPVTVDVTPAPALAGWDAAATYTAGDRVATDGAEWRAAWWTQGQRPGDPYGPWEEIRTAADGGTVWTASRIFGAGDAVQHDGTTFVAQWWTRDQVPGDPYGPWAVTA
jgi:hypothetical protein